MNLQINYPSKAADYVKPIIFLFSLILLIGTWFLLYWSETQFTESHLVGYYCCVSEQDLPTLGTLERTINDFFKYSPGKHLLSVVFIFINVSLFIIAMFKSGKKYYWLLLSFIFLNIVYFSVDFNLVVISWLISDWIEGPQTTVYKGYHRTGYGIVLHLALWSAFFIILSKVNTLFRLNLVHPQNSQNP